MTTPFSWNNPYAWPRKPLLAANAVSTSQPLAAQAGLQMLAAGGSAVDAILATAITLSLVEPVSNGIGSDAYAIVWDGRRLHGLNASGRSPAAARPAPPTPPALLEPVSNGIGSDAYAIVWDGRRLHGLNASGRSPAAWTPDFFARLESVPGRGWERGS